MRFNAISTGKVMTNISLDEMHARTALLLGRPGVERLQSTIVAVAGCGGVGGAHAITMARLGVRRFRLADPGRFDPPDLNRQWGASHPTLGQNKARVYAKLLAEINPKVDVEVFDYGLHPENQREFVAGADILLDGLDVAVPLEQRAALYETASQRGLFVITSPILGFGALVAAAKPGASMGLFVRIYADLVERGGFAPRFYDHFDGRHLRQVEQGFAGGKIPSLALAPLISTSLVATECLTFLLQGSEVIDRAPITLPKLITIDLARLQLDVVDAVSLLHEPALAVGGQR
jgi:hypothetical protein